MYVAVSYGYLRYMLNLEISAALVRTDVMNIRATHITTVNQWKFKADLRTEAAYIDMEMYRQMRNLVRGKCTL